jgi:hypothetical protein
MAAVATSHLENVFQELVAERNAALSVGELAIARKLAELITLDNDPDPPSTAKAISTLMELLPPKTEKEPEKPLDLTVLSDAEFTTLDRLLARCRGEEPPPPIKHRRVRPARWRILRNVCLFLDDKEKEHRQLTDAERHKLRTMIRDAMVGVIPFELLWTSELSTRPVSVVEPEPVIELEREEVPPPNIQNVVLLRSDPDTAGLRYGALYIGSDGTGGHFGDNTPRRY